MFYSGYVALIGKPNVGKSTLINALIGEKVSIISHKPQTTRDNLLGIYNGDDCQIIFIDTPGLHHSKNALDKAMAKNVRTAVSGADVCLFLVDGTKGLDSEDEEYLQHLQTQKMVIKTKNDKPGQKEFNYDLSISSLTGENLKLLIEKVKACLPKYDQPMYIYPQDYYTDKSIKFLIAEQLREEALNLLAQEVPHGIAVEIIRFEESEKLVKIDADIVCEAERHKGIIIGKNGANLKKIGSSARQYAQQLLQQQVMLKLFVKVERDWRDKPEKVKNLGY